MKNAAIYSANPQRLNSSLLSSIGKIRGLKTDAQDAPAFIEVTIDSNRFRINSMPEAEVGQHLEGFRQYIESYHAEHPMDNLGELLTYVNSICCVYGLVFATEFDFDSETWQVIKQIADLVDGVIFVCDSLVDTEDMVVFGPLGEG